MITIEGSILSVFCTNRVWNLLKKCSSQHKANGGSVGINLAGSAVDDILEEETRPNQVILQQMSYVLDAELSS